MHLNFFKTLLSIQSSPEKQIENERGVILEEMSLYRDNPEDAIQDEFDHVIFEIILWDKIS